MYKKTLMNFLSLILLMLIVNTIFSPTACSQNEPELLIEVYDSNNWSAIPEDIVFEGKSYLITVSTENITAIPEVNITVLGTTYLTNISEPYITIEIPPFNESDSFIITATKEGYRPGTIQLTVLKGELTIKTDKVLIDENTEFQVTVTDQDNNPVEDALVYVTEDASPMYTNQQGKALVQAPEIDILTTTTIQVIKSGYLPGSTTIRIENVEGSIFNLTESKFLQILPVLLAILVVIVSVLYVFLRQRRAPTKMPYNSQGKTPDEPRHYHKEKQQRFKTETDTYPKTEKRNISRSNSESRVEEIRIPVQAKKRGTTILTEEKEAEQIPEDENKHPDEWFKGQDYMRYKIDELTGKIDQNTDGKWFEGEQDTKYKVDEALKKNLKKKKVEEDSNE
ncbi:MAG TPA: Ig-like domain-containing protein [Candidatus Thermoplasmatota archaeon]|nr:Ig-like domain-containing protein [Candidatus Thermoplasmatota archaeon]